MHKILILGGSGLVGTAIINEMNRCREFQHYATYFKNPTPLNEDRSFKMNIDDSDSISNILTSLQPNIIISCLRGSFKKQLCLHIKVAEYLEQRGGRLYFFSTANVFDNDLSKAHYEDDLPESHTEYGQYKIECEKRMIEILEDNVSILRIPQVWGRNSPRMKEFLNALSHNKDFMIYPKLFINTNTNVMIAKQLCYIIENNLKGIFHLASEEVVNYKDFYSELITGLGFNNVNIVESFDEEGYFALLSRRNNEFPKQLRLTNKDVIRYLI